MDGDYESMMFTVHDGQRTRAWLGHDAGKSQNGRRQQMFSSTKYRGTRGRLSVDITLDMPEE